MLSDAGVDMVVFDVTNQLTYPESWQALCRVWDQIQREGNRVPQIAFLCPFGDPNKVVHELWTQLYQPGTYEALWFRWEGKPLILADPARVVASDDEASQIHNFFTFRKPQPSYFIGPTGAEQWERALEIDPPFVFVAGWNEWIAGRFNKNAPFYGSGSVTFVDQFDQEFSRDCEPMKGGYRDNNYD